MPNAADNGPVLAFWWDRDVVRIAGPDAAAFLQGQLSQDVDAVAPGTSAWALLLQPQGKVDAFVRLTRVGGDEFVVDVDAGWGEATVARLERFKLRVKADVERLPWRCLALRSGDGVSPVRVDTADVLAVTCDWPGFSGTDLLGEEPAVPAGIEIGDAVDLERRRIAAGFPRMGAELDVRTIPAEAGVVER
jgi:folate-binding Fe-S cluster repair protein YgfZ